MRTTAQKIALAAALAIAGHTVAAAQDVTLRFSNWLPPTHPVVTEILEPWVKDVEKVTEGRVKVEMLPALGAPPAHFELALNGVTDIAFGVSSYSPERFKLTEIAELPVTAENAEVLSLAYWNTYNKFLLSRNEHAGTKLLGLWVAGSYQLYTNKNVTQFEDLPGTKIRIPGTIVKQIASAMGMVTISSPVTEAYDQVSRGIIDGMFQNHANLIDFNMTEHLRHLFRLPGGYSASSQFLVMNEAAWNRISPTDQAAIEAISNDALVRRASGVWQKNNSDALKKVLEAGIVLHEIQGAQLEDTLTKIAFVEKDWIRDATALGVDGAGAVAFLRAEIDRIAAEMGVPKN